MKKTALILVGLIILIASCSNSEGTSEVKDGDSGGDKVENQDTATKNLVRSIELINNAVDCYFEGDGMKMSRFYNPYTESRSEEVASVWMYTSSIEAVNAVLRALKTQKEKGNTQLYDQYFEHYKQLLSRLYDCASFYAGTFTLTSYTQTKEWTVYGVNRGKEKGMANVEGVLNVYDDQMWLIRELIEAYRLTNEQKYLDKAEYLTAYVLDGWDCTLNSEGKENGGITWGPGYTTKHSCSNGPIVSPLVWLSDIYKNSSEQITYRYITSDKHRVSASMLKKDYYLKMAKSIYDWQKGHLMTSDGVYDDMMGGCVPNCDVVYEQIDGVKYRANTQLRDRVGPKISYNSGTMLSGAAELYQKTSESVFRDDMKALSESSFRYFAKVVEGKPGCYQFDVTGFNDWFNCVLMRGYMDAYAVDDTNAKYIEAYQNNLDYAYSHYLYKHMLPVNLLVGWSKDKNSNKVEGMFTFAFATEYAVLANYELTKK